MTTIQHRRGTAAQWTAANRVLAAGEWGVETDTGLVKLGDGVTAWTDLLYFASGSGGSVAWNEITGKPTVFPPTTHDHPVSDIDATGTPSGSTYLRGDGVWATPEGGDSVGASYPQTVLVVTGTEARPAGSDVVLWIDTRSEGATRPDNMDNVADLWFTPNGAASGDTEAPSVPTGLASSAITETSFTVTWSASTDNVAVTGYQVRLDGGTPISESALSHDFTDLTAETAYSVDVRARDAAGNWSAWSTALPVTTSEASIVPPPTTRFDFDEGSGSTTAGTGGFNLTTSAPETAWGSAGKIDGVFNGRPLGTGGDTDTYSEWTVAIDCTINAYPASGWAALAEIGGGTPTIYLQYGATGTLQYFSASALNSSGPISIGTHRVVVTQTTSTVTVYVDGVSVATRAESRPFAKNGFMTLLSTIGQLPDAEIDTFRVWTLALDAAQVAAIGA